MGRRWAGGVGGALRRAREPILWMALTYAIAFAVGAAMVHRHQASALAQRDAIVGTSQTSDPAALSLRNGRPLLAALYDFGGNLVLGAIPSTIMGLGVVLPFPTAAHRGWVGGLVSVDGSHASRFGSWHEGSYFTAVVLLQLVPYVLAGGAGVRLGLANLMPGRVAGGIPRPLIELAHTSLAERPGRRDRLTLRTPLGHTWTASVDAAESEPIMPSMTVVGRVGIWVPTLLLAFIFLMAGAPKLAGTEAHVRHFVTWGYPDWFRLVVGAIEVTSAVLLLVPRVAFLGAIGIAVIMSGATYTHLIRVPEEAGRAPFTLTLLAIALLVAYFRRPRRLRPAS